MLRARLLPAASRIWQYLCICIPLLLAGTSQAQDGPYNNSFLDGLYFPQDIFTLLTGDGATGIGARDFDGDDRLSSIVTFGTRTPLTYEVRDDGRFRLYDDEIDWGFAGSIGLGGDLLVFSPQAARREDLQITEGYAGLRISTVESGSWGDSDFKGSYSYHALLFKGDDWFSETGAVEADGNGRMTLLRAGTPALNLSYDVGGNGRVVIDGGNPQRASITADGDVVIHVLDVGRNDDPLHPAGYEGLALYVRRKSTTTAIPREWLSGTYQVHQLRVSTPTTPLASTGTVTAGGNFTFFGTLGGVAYADHLKVYPTGVFELSNQDTWTGTLTAGGDVAVVSAASGIPRLQIWLRTAGGSALPGDRDGDGVRDDRESARGTDLNRADTDGDGLLDNVDTRPATADNRFTAVLDADEFSVTEGATTPIETSLILDSNDFPFFDWSVASDADWLTIDPAKGSGDKSLKLTIDPTELTSADSPSVATLTVTAPNMQAVAPLELVVNVEPTPVTLALTPTSLTFTAVEGASPPPARSVALSSTDATTFAWTATATAAWLKVTPVNGNGPATLSVEVNPAALSTAASPFTGSVQVSLAGASTPSASTQVTLNLLPRRDPGLAWRVSPTGTAQDDPAADADSETGRWVLAWQENSQIVSLVLAADGTPLAGPLPVSLAIQGTAVAPQVVVAPGEGFAWIFWQQNNTGSVSSIQARRWNLDSLVLSNVFGIAGGRTGRSAPHAVLSGDGKEVVVAYELAQDIGSAIEWTRLNASTNTAIESRILWQSNDRLAAPRIAAAPNGYLVAAAIQRFDGSSSGVWARLLGNGGAPVGEPIALDTGDAFADMPVPAYAGLPSAYPRVAAYPWHIAWRQRSSVTSQDTDYILGRLSPNGTVSREPLGSGSAFGHTQTAASLPEQSQFVYQTTAEPVGILRRRITTGGFLLDTPLAYPQGAGSQRHPGVAYSIGANEFLTLWQDLRHGHGQIYALREDAGSTDEDGDGLSNDWELTFDLSPFNADGDNGAAGDPDLDGLTNTDEYRMQTNPTKRDSDDDGLWDRQEDRDRDGVLDPGESSPSDADTDDDGFRDDAEWFTGSKPDDGNSIPPAGLYRIDYTPLKPGVPALLSLFAVVHEQREYQLRLNGDWNSPAGWTIEQPAPQQWGRGVHAVEIPVIPPAQPHPDQLLVSCAFELVGSGKVGPDLSAILPLDLLKTDKNKIKEAGSIAARYAPVLKLHRDEFFQMTPIEVTLERSRLDRGNTRFLPARPDFLDLYQSPQGDARVDVDGESIEAIRDQYPVAPPAPKLYYTLAELTGPSQAGTPPAGHAALQYYLHYTASDWGFGVRGGQRHEGDWQLIQLLLDEDGEPYRVTVTEHWQLALDGGAPGAATLPWESVERLADHPVLYAGQGSHALYFRSGAQRYSTGLDVHDGLGAWAVPWQDAAPALVVDYPDQRPMTLELLPRLTEFDQPHWLRFAGRWGQDNFPQAANDDPTPSTRSGPRGPVFMPARGLAASPWLDPYGWAGAGEATEVTAAVTGTLPPAYAGRRVLALDARGQVFRADVAESGSFHLDLPLSTYQFSVAEEDELGYEAWVKSVRFSGTSLRLVPVPAEGLELGLAVEEESALVAANVFLFLDSDGDGVPDASDPDPDNDGAGNGDADSLGDGFLDAYQLQDRDEDSIPAYLDEDDDGDGVPDSTDSDRDGNNIDDAEEPADHDGDGFMDAVDLDADNDGYSNAAEREAGTDPLRYFDTPLLRLGDANGDGATNAVDLQLMVNNALRVGPYPPRGDFNEDGRIDAGDIQRTVEVILESP